MKIQDNYQQTLSSIKIYLTNALPKLMGEEGKIKLNQIYDDFYYELKKGNAECQLEIKFDNVEYPVEDDEGNIYSKLIVKTHVSWPSWHNANAKVTIECAQFQLAVAEFALSLEDYLIYDVFSLNETKEEVQVRKEQNKKLLLQTEVDNVVLNADKKRMRVDNDKAIDLPKDIPEGEYESNDGNKVYKLIITSGLALLKRIK